MKIKIGFFGFLAMCMLIWVTLVFSGCRKDRQAVYNGESVSPTIMIRPATDGLLNIFDSYYEYNDDNNGERIAIWAEFTLRNLNFISVGFEDSLFAENTLYAIYELQPKQAFVIKTFISEGIPTCGISYLDENNEIKYFYISESGLDGSLSLVEFQNTPPVEQNTAEIMPDSYFFVDYANDNNNDFMQFIIDEEGDYFLFRKNEQLEDMCVISIAFDDDINFYQDDVLTYLPDDLGEFVIKAEAAATIPNRGISFTDEYGIRKFFYITFDEYGSVRLIELQNNH